VRLLDQYDALCREQRQLRDEKRQQSRVAAVKANMVTWKTWDEFEAINRALPLEQQRD
jgi:hypothetical protein